MTQSSNLLKSCLLGKVSNLLEDATNTWEAGREVLRGLLRIAVQSGS